MMSGVDLHLGGFGGDNVDFKLWMKMDMQDPEWLALTRKILRHHSPRAYRLAQPNERPTHAPHSNARGSGRRYCGKPACCATAIPHTRPAFQWTGHSGGLRHDQYQRMLSVGLSRPSASIADSRRPLGLHRGAGHGRPAGGLRRAEAIRAREVDWADASTITKPAALPPVPAAQAGLNRWSWPATACTGSKLQEFETAAAILDAAWSGWRADQPTAPEPPPWIAAAVPIWPGRRRSQHYAD